MLVVSEVVAVAERISAIVLPPRGIESFEILVLILEFCQLKSNFGDASLENVLVRLNNCSEGFVLFAAQGIHCSTLELSIAAVMSYRRKGVCCFGAISY